MKAIINKQDIATAIEELKASGRKTTIANIHAALGGRGSLTTIVKLKAEIEADGVAANDSEEGLKAFRDLWALAREEGRKAGEAEAAELRAGLDTMASEAGRLETEVETSTRRVVEIATQRDNLVADLSRANEQTIAARAAGEQAASKLAETLSKLTDMQTSHLAESKASADRLADCQARGHQLELQLARTEEQRDSLRRAVDTLTADNARLVAALRAAEEREQKLAIELASRPAAPSPKKSAKATGKQLTIPGTHS